MQRSILLAWAVGLGIMTWRGVKEYSRPVPPGQYMAASGLYALMALLAEYQPAAAAAATVAWSFDLAVLLQVLPEQITGAKTSGGKTTVTTTKTAQGV